VAVCATSDSLWFDFFDSGEDVYMLFGLMITGDIVANSGQHFTRNAFHVISNLLPKTVYIFLRTEWCCGRASSVAPAAQHPDM